MFLIDWPGGSWEATLRITLTVLALYLAAIWVTLVFWTYRDIRQRTRDPILQTVAVLLVLVFFLPGHWLYLILRPRYTLTELYERSLEEEALLQELEDQKACPGCNRRIQDEFILCPYCRTTLKEPCRECTRPLNRAWLACPYCGVEKPAAQRHRVRHPQPARASRSKISPPQRQQQTRAQDMAPGPPQPQQRPQPQAVRTESKAPEESESHTTASKAQPESRPPTPSRDPFAPRHNAPSGNGRGEQRTREREPADQPTMIDATTHERSSSSG